MYSRSPSCARTTISISWSAAECRSTPFPRFVRRPSVRLTRFETRKVIFDAACLDVRGIEDGFLEAIQFELLWLTNKRDYYSSIEREDHKRVANLEGRWGGLLPPSLREE